MKVVLAAFGTRGDVQPMLALARGLLKRGHQATVAGPPDFEAAAACLGVPFLPVGEPIRTFLARVSDERGQLLPRVALGAMPGWLRSHYAPLEGPVREADVVLAASMTVAPLDLAERHGKRAHSVAYCPQAVPSGEHPMAFVSRQGLPRWLNRLSFAFGALGHRLGVKAHLDRERHQLGLPPGPETWDHILYRNLVVASEPALAPLPADVRPGRWVLQPGAFYLEEDEAPQAAVAAFVEEGPPPVYLGFGSMPDVVPGATLGWVTRAADAAEVRVVLQGPQAGRSGRVLTVPEVSHRWLFPRCAGVVHHGGAGTTARAARCGVPQVLVPHVTDQFYWRERLRRLGVLGLEVDLRTRDERQLAAALRDLAGDAGRAGRARALAAAIPGDGVARMVAALEAPLPAAGAAA